MKKLKIIIFAAVAGLLIRVVPLLVNYNKDVKDGMVGYRTNKTIDIKTDKKYTETLKEFAREANNDCPRIIDEGVRMERAYYLDTPSWQRIVFEYTLLHTEKSCLDLEELRENLSKELLDKLKTDNSFYGIRNSKVILQFVYFDNQHEELADIRFLLNDPIILWPIQ
jgi:hypothetical protein